MYYYQNNSLFLVVIDIALIQLLYASVQIDNSKDSLPTIRNTMVFICQIRNVRRLLFLLSIS